METYLSTLADLDAAARRFLGHHPRGAVVGLSGELGAGKTTFVRAIIAALAARGGAPAPRVTSPTFVLHQGYGELAMPVEHFDLYRLEQATAAALVEIGYYEALERTRAAGGFCFVEWPERAADAAALQLDTRLWLGFREEGRLLRETP